MVGCGLMSSIQPCMRGTPRTDGARPARSGLRRGSAKDRQEFADLRHLCLDQATGGGRARTSRPRTTHRPPRRSTCVACRAQSRPASRLATRLPSALLVAQRGLSARPPRPPAGAQMAEYGRCPMLYTPEAQPSPCSVPRPRRTSQVVQHASHQVGRSPPRPRWEQPVHTPGHTTRITRRSPSRRPRVGSPRRQSSRARRWADTWPGALGRCRAQNR